MQEKDKTILVVRSACWAAFTAALVATLTRPIGRIYTGTRVRGVTGCVSTGKGLNFPQLLLEAKDGTFPKAL